MISYKRIFRKKTLKDKLLLANLLAVSPLVSIFPGDILDIFSIRLGYTDDELAKATQKPV